ncbi:transcriptional repressor LexA [Calditrichota bacterium]
MAKHITDRQKAVLLRIGEGLRDQNYPPTLREIGALEGITSTNGVRCVLDALEKKGYITRKKYQSRAIEFTAKGRNEVMPSLAGTGDATIVSISMSDTLGSASRIVYVPLVGKVAAGVPLLAEQNIEQQIAVDEDFAPKGETFALRVKGQSMIEAGIHDGDVVFCRVQNDAVPGDIVVALIGDEATVKYYHPEGDRILLKPANEYFGPIVVDSDTEGFQVLGKVVSLFRKY